MVNFGKYNLTKVYNSFFPTFVLYNSLFQHSVSYGGETIFLQTEGGNSIWGGEGIVEGGERTPEDTML